MSTPTSPSTSAGRLALCAACLCALAAVAAPPSGRQAGDRPAGAEPPPAPLVLTARLAPSPAGRDALLRLSVVVENRGERPVSAFRFEVAAEGLKIAAYRDAVFLAPVSPGERRTLPLHNLWASETGRPPPADGELTVEISLVEAAWVARERIPEGLRWRTLGPVEGLPLRIAASAEIR